jgi:two-component system C4-dicarboxylate transport response regulator DctD
LVVDDDQLLLESVASALEARGYAVWVTDSVKRAITLAREVEPDVVVSDYRMPGMDGISLLARLREISERPRMVVYSATPLEEQAELARLGVTWIAKTARHGSLLGTLEGMLDEGAGE